MRETYMCIVFATICLGCSAHSAHAQDTKTAPLVFSESIPVAQTQDVDVRNVRLVGAVPKKAALGTKKSSLTITPGKYWLGGAIGSVAGFGIGHAIVGEYGSMGVWEYRGMGVWEHGSMGGYEVLRGIFLGQSGPV